jgi:DNA gyrase subunit A
MSEIIEVSALEQYKKDSIEYAIMVNRVRMIPDVRDGLKTIHRRIETAMYFDNPRTHTGHVKSAKIVGDVMGKYHPKYWGM